MFAIFLIIAGVLLRLVPHIPNVAPIAGMALFGGTYLNKKYALIIPLAAMIISDMFLGFSASTPLVYTSFVITGFLGLWLRNHKNFGTVIGASLLSSTIFYVLTNFNFWYATALYPKNFSGMIDAYVMALPFFRNTIFGDLFYTGVFFGSYELVKVFVSKYAKSFSL